MPGEALAGWVEHRAAAAVLRRDGVVTFRDRGVTAGEVRAVVHRWDPESEEDSVTRHGLPGTLLPVVAGPVGPESILSEAAARRPVAVVGLLLTGDVTPAQEGRRMRR